jgi:hypothetical protein
MNYSIPPTFAIDPKNPEWPVILPYQVSDKAIDQQYLKITFYLAIVNTQL